MQDLWAFLSEALKSGHGTLALLLALACFARPWLLKVTAIFGEWQRSTPARRRVHLEEKVVDQVLNAPTKEHGDRACEVLKLLLGAPAPNLNEPLTTDPRPRGTPRPAIRWRARRRPLDRPTAARHGALERRAVRTWRRSNGLGGALNCPCSSAVFNRQTCHAVAMWLDPEAKAYAEQLNQRRAELAAQATNHVKKQHVISQVILRRFTWDKPPGGVEMARLDVNRLDRRVRLLGTKACGKVDDFIRYASKDAEEMWSRIENAFPAALAAADDGSILDKPHLMEVIKDMLALHTVRSKEAPIIHQTAWEAVSGAIRDQLRQRPECSASIWCERPGSS